MVPGLQGKARVINDRLPHTETAGQDTVLVSPVTQATARIARDYGYTLAELRKL